MGKPGNSKNIGTRKNNVNKTEEQLYNEQIASDRKAIEDFLDTKGDYNSIQLGNQIFEKLSQKELRTWLGDVISYGVVDEDTSLFIQYKDGTTVSLNEGDSTKGIKKNGIRNAIISNSATVAFTGPDIKFYDFSEETREWQRQNLSNSLKSGRASLDYNIDWRVTVG